MFHYNGIDNTIMTFRAGSGCVEGQLCKLSGSNLVEGCGAGDAFHGMVQKLYPGDMGGVIVRGVVRVGYTGTAPTVGWSLLSANGTGGVQVDDSQGRAYLVLKVDAETRTAEIYL